MADPDGLDVTNLKITTWLAPLPTGGPPVKQNVVTYNVGPHGPFEDCYAPAQFTEANVKQAITQQVQKVRAIAQVAKTT